MIQLQKIEANNNWQGDTFYPSLQNNSLIARTKIDFLQSRFYGKLVFRETRVIEKSSFFFLSIFVANTLSVLPKWFIYHSFLSFSG
jgi:hypothetical protein